MFKRGLKLSLVTITLMGLGSGCVDPGPVVLEKAGSSISENNTIYTSVLRDTNDMIKVFVGHEMNVVVNSIENKTGNRGRLPADISEIVTTSFNEIGDSVVVIHNLEAYDVSKKAVYIINGAITEYDKIYTNDTGVNASGTGTVGKRHNEFDTDGSIDNENAKISLAINFNPAYGHRGTYIPRASTSNKVIIEKKSNANAFAFSILGSGFGFNNAVTKSQGIHASITALVELSVAEVLGKIGKFPYWLLEKGGKVNEDIVHELVNRFVRIPLTERVKQVSYLLALHGKDVDVTTVINDKLKKAIIEYKQEHGMGADDTISKELFKRLLYPN